MFLLFVNLFIKTAHSWLCIGILIFYGMDADSSLTITRDCNIGGVHRGILRYLIGDWLIIIHSMLEWITLLASDRSVLYNSQASNHAATECQV